MSARFEKYLITQRKNLDVETPDDASIWKRIKKELHNEGVHGKQPAGKISQGRIRNIAAAAIILFSLGYIVNGIINARDNNHNITLSSINRELGLREKDYKTLIRLKTEEVSSFAGSSDMVIRELFEEIKELDTIYDQATSDLGELGTNEKVINTIFRTYEQKIRLLELIILETNKINIHEKNNKIIL